MHRLLLLTIIIPYFFFGQQTKSITNDKYVYPDSSWQSLNNVSESGWNNDSLNRLKSFIIDSTNATGVVAIQSGKILFDYGDTKENSYLASCRKSILSMLYGPFVKD